MYRLAEVFPTIQGEGVNVGLPMTIVRFSGCNLVCPFCDTDHTCSFKIEAPNLAEMVRGFGINRVLLTGGEPLLQLDVDLLFAIRQAFHEQNVGFFLETNGSLPLSFMLRSLLSWVTVSPKVPADLVAVNYPSVNAIDEARWLVKAGDPLPPRLKNARHHVLSPLFDGAIPNAANINHAVALAKENPDWRVSCQMHKLLGLR